MNAFTAQLEEVDRPRTGTIKFTYPSGSRPLDGYTIKRGVGRGGFGEVYFATSDAGKEVALKLIRRNLEVELRGVTQCLNLKHANLIGLYDIRTDETGDQWVIMEYVSGESLEDVIERSPAGMPVEEVLWWMSGIAAGVAYLHDHGIVHRDLKPGNIFTDEGIIKIGDYGLAKFISCSRRSGQTESVGTVHYMAPEIANGRYGREIDTYALGIILFEMLTGSVPFEGESVGEVLMKHLTAEPDLSVLQEPYRDIVRRALAKDPEVRLKSVGEMMSLLPAANGVRPLPYVNFAVHRSADAAVQPQMGATPARASMADDVARVGGAALSTPVRPVTSREIQEPIWQTIRDTFSKLGIKSHGKLGEDMHPLPKALMIFAIVAACLFLWAPLTSFAIPVLICYGVYYMIWASVIRPGMHRHSAREAATLANNSAGMQPVVPPTYVPDPVQRAAAEVNAPVRPAMTARPRRVRPTWRDRANQELAAKPLRTKLAELSGSMILASLFAVVAACIAPVLLSGEGSSDNLAMHLWLAIVGTLGSWAILVPTKFSEGKLEDQAPMRITLLALGAVVGLAAWGLSEALFVHLPSWDDPIDVGRGFVSHELLDQRETSGNANPALAVFMTYFAFLLVVPRWWRQSESTRHGRLSLWTMIVCVGWAWLLHLAWWFPQPAGMMVAAVIAVSTQLASPWMPPSRRRALSGDIERTV